MSGEAAGLDNRGGLVSDAPRIVIILAIEAPPRVVVEDGAGNTWSRLADWLIGSGQADLLLGLLGLLRQAKEPTS